MKKLLAIVLTAVLAMSALVCLTACDEKLAAGEYNITVWVSESAGVKELTEQQIAKFNELHESEGVKINATVEGISEKDSATQMITSVEDGADLYCFAQDQLARLVQACALNPLGKKALKEVQDNNDAGAVRAASVGGLTYCYPLTSDNGYFMYYDKSVITDPSHLTSLEKLIEDCEKANKNFSMELETSAWYNASFFFATGCKSEWTTNDDGEFTAVDDTFNSDEGVIALKGMQKILKSKSYVSSSDGAEAGKGAAIVITGTWAKSAVQNALGENMGVCELPSFTVDGKTYHMGSYSGNKLMGVKPTTDTNKAAVLQALALYLTGEECQLARFSNFGWGPSNKKAQASDAVKADPTLAALAAQNAYAIPQGEIHGSWWDIAKTYASSAKAATTDQQLKDALKAYEDAIEGLFSMSADAKRAFTVIGKFEDHNWDFDVEMEETAPNSNIWISKLTITFAQGDEFKVRQGKSWDVAFGTNGNNYVVETAGQYYVKLVFDGTNGTITLETSK